MTQATMPPDAAATHKGFLAVLLEQGALARDLTSIARTRLTRIKYMGEVIERIGGDGGLGGVDDDFDRVAVCAEVILEAGRMIEGELERIESACTILSEGLRREVGNA